MRRLESGLLHRELLFSETSKGDVEQACDGMGIEDVKSEIRRTECRALGILSFLRMEKSPTRLWWTVSGDRHVSRGFTLNPKRRTLKNSNHYAGILRCQIGGPNRLFIEALSCLLRAYGEVAPPLSLESPLN